MPDSPKKPPPKGSIVENSIVREALQPGDEDLVRVSDFSSAQVEVRLQNTTTKMTAKNEPPISIAEFLEKGLILEVPPRSCSKGHNVLLEMVVRLPDGSEVQFESTGKVDAIESVTETQTDRITVTLVQFEESDWQRLQEAFSSRQADIESFFKATRGY